MSDLAARNLPVIDLDDFERRLRHAPDPVQTNEDPLSALARLVHKNDPFQSVFDEAPSPRAAAPVSAPAAAAPKAQGHAQAPLMDFNVSQKPIADALRDYTAAAQQHEEAAFQQHQDAGYADGAGEHTGDIAGYHAAAQSDPQYETDHQPAGADSSLHAYAAEPPRRMQIPRKALFAGVALSVVAVAGVATAIGFRGLPTNHAAMIAPLIKASTSPVKVAPPMSETAAAEAGPSVLDKAAPADGAANAKVVTREEQPTDIAPTVRSVKTVRIGEGAGTPTTSALTATLAPNASALPEPKRVKTVLVRPDGSIVGDQPAAIAAPSFSNVAAGQTPSPKAPEIKPAIVKAPELVVTPPVKAVAAPLAVTPAKAATRIIPAAPAKPVQVAEAQDSGPAPLQLAPSAGAKTKPIRTASRDVPAAPAADDTVQTTGSTTGGAFAVQLAAPGSEQEAKDASARMQKQYASALGSYQPSIRKASDKSVYRVRVSNLSKDEADALCGKLKAAGGACFVARN